MSPRELIILVLGLCIVAVVLRGLYVALQARRGQIRLAIDKNIPQDVDLESLEMAELPSGGARVVERSLESVVSHNSMLDAAEQKAQSLDLGADDNSVENIPVLMDTVELRHEESVEDYDDQTEPQYEQSHVEAMDEPSSSFDDNADNEWDEQRQSEAFDNQAEDDFSFEESSVRSPTITESSFIDDSPRFAGESPLSDSHELESSAGFHAENEGDEISRNEVADSKSDILLDYGKAEEDVTDPMAAIAPDYESDYESECDEDEFEEENPHSEESHSDVDQDYFEDEIELNEVDEELEEEQEEGVSQSFEEQLDSFSMSAGERIGYGEAEKAAQQPPSQSPKTPHSSVLGEQAGLFDDEAAEEEVEESYSAAENTSKAKPRSLFSAFKRFGKKEVEAEEQDTHDFDEEQIDYPEETPVSIENDPLSDSAFNGNESDSEEAAEQFNDYDELDQPSDSSLEPSAAELDVEEEQSANSEPSEVLVLNVMAQEGYSFAGDDLLQVLITAGLKFGEMNIFHHRIESRSGNNVLFSVANVLNPGTFDLNNMHNFSTLGVSFFLALPSVTNNLEAFETMLSIAQQVKGGLDGELKDDNRSIMTAQTIEHYRQRVRDFELRQLKAASSKA